MTTFQPFFVCFRNLTDEQLLQYQVDPDSFEVEGYKLEANEIRIKYTLAESGLDQNLADKYEADSQGGILVLLNVQQDSSMKDEGTAREIINRVQKLRKEARLVPSDPITVYYQLLPVPEDEKTVDLERVCVEFAEYIKNSLKAEFIDMAPIRWVKAPEFLIESTSDIKGESIKLAIQLHASSASAGGDKHLADQTTKSLNLQ